MIVIFVEFIDQLIDYPINGASPTAQSDQGFPCPLTESLDTTECMNDSKGPDGILHTHIGRSKSAYFEYVPRLGTFFT